MDNVYTLEVPMDIQYELHGQRFEWDAEKAAANLLKHRVSFAEACEVFFDPFLALLEASGDDETREAAIGLTEDWSLLVVVHVVRQANTLRIISARPATPAERREYENE
jgi:uncharacterized DUF497 family protein